MDAEKWRSIKDAFTSVVGLSESERNERLRQIDPGVRVEVEHLLRAHFENDEFFDRPLFGHQYEDGTDPNLGRDVGQYVLKQKIGSGGMGLVYLAERKDFSQKVAVKLIKRGMDSDAILDRFLLERQILSRLNHPNIAHLLDGGITDDGLPYFVMEFVDGSPLLRFSDQNALDTNERLRLFRKVCSAVSYAHQNLIVHRDIKPSNILVTEDNTPKLLDFGIAKLLDADAEGTATQLRIFTPEYASPEQINGLPITTASDVYSLGVVLYELLTGVRPFDPSGKDYREVAEMILSVEPLKPSSVVLSRRTAAGRETPLARQNTADETVASVPNPQSASRALRGDIDNIILKALRKEPARRYGSVQELSEDIRRSLAGLPVTATADSRVYRMRKFVRRHSLGTAALAIFVVLAMVAVYQGIAATRERAKAERRLVETRKIANSLMFEIHDSLATMPGATASREILVKRALEYLDSLSQESDASPELMRELAIAYRKLSDILGNPEFSSLGKRSDSLLYCQRAFDIHSKLLETDPLNLDSLKEVGSITETLSSAYPTTKGDWDEGLKYARISQATHVKLSELEPTEAKWKSRLAKRYNYSGFILANKHDHEGAEEDYKLSIKYTEEAVGLAPDDAAVLVPAASVFSMTARRLADVDYNDYGKTDEALIFLEKALAIRTKLLQRDPNNVGHKRSLAVVYDDLGVLASRRNDHLAANDYFAKGLTLFDEIIGKDPNDVMVGANKAYNLMKHGVSLSAQGKDSEAVNIQKQAVALHEKWMLTDPESVETVATLSQSKEHLADTLLKIKRLDEARQMYEESMAHLQKALDLSKVPTHEIIIPSARLHLKLGKLDQANVKECITAKRHFQTAYELLNDFRRKDRLSPRNIGLFNEIESLADTFCCPNN